VYAWETARGASLLSSPRAVCTVALRHWVEAMPRLNRVVKAPRADADLSTEAYALELLARPRLRGRPCG
jgi:hypothetical protein